MPVGELGRDVRVGHKAVPVALGADGHQDGRGEGQVDSCGRVPEARLHLDRVACRRRSRHHAHKKRRNAPARSALWRRGLLRHVHARIDPCRLAWRV